MHCPPCKICGADTGVLGRATVLGRHPATWRQCEACGFVFVEDPSWLAEAYAEPINASDTGYVGRNLWAREKVRGFIETFLPPAGRFLDFAAGYGLLVRLMRDAGYDFRWQDGYCQNLFARGFEAASPLAGRFDAVTAFEVFEHLVDPVADLRPVFDVSPCVLFSTVLLPEPVPALADWAYYGLEHGQHVSLFTRRSLAALAARSGRCFVTDGDFHVLSRAPVTESGLRRLNRRWWKSYLGRCRRRASLTESDHAETVRRLSPGPRETRTATTVPAGARP